MSLSCKISRVMRTNQSTNYSTCSALVLDGQSTIPDYIPNKKEIVIKGYFPTNKSLTLTIDGEWTSSNYGYALKVTHFEETLPKTEAEMIEYLSSFIANHKAVERVVAHFGKNTFSVFENHPELLLNVRGIGRTNLCELIDGYNHNRQFQDLITFLSPVGFNAKKCLKVMNELGENALKKIKENPFCLTDVGISFREIERIPTKSAPDSSNRIQSGITQVLYDGLNEGHVCLNQVFLIAATYLMLNGVKYQREKVLEAIKGFANSQNPDLIKGFVKSDSVSIFQVYKELISMANSGMICGDNGFAYLPNQYKYEVESSIIIRKRLTRATDSTFSDVEIQNEIHNLEIKNKIKLATKQREAIFLGVRNNTCIITGGPGVGKTTVLKMVLQVCMKFLNLSSSDVTLLAPTGRAAQRMAESVGDGFSASTIHSALKISKEGQETFEHLSGKIIVVDESSMVDAYIGWCLLNAVSEESKLIIIGDAEQLPSVGAGNFLFELLKSKYIPTVRLDVIYRQSGTSPIVTNSDLIRKGIENLKFEKDFQFIPVRQREDFPSSVKNIGEEIQRETARLVVEQFFEELKNSALDDVQVLCPMRKDGVLAGASEINRLIQDRINPPNQNNSDFIKGKDVFRIGDKIILKKNHYDIAWEDSNHKHGNGLFNGDVGYIQKIDKATRTVTINFSGKISVLDFAQMEDIDLAYAISIHKSQGSQYKTVIIPIINAFSIMLKRNLLYTGITRAKHRVILVGHQKAIAQSIKTNVIAKRNTQLGLRLKEENQ